jgi:DNA invertase Pin-like site-specific DNA recombinase
LFWKLDRFSREGVRKTLFYLTQLDGWKVGWRSFQEQWFDSCGPFKDAVISIMATLAEQERITISERTKAGLTRTVRGSRRCSARR